MFNIRLTIPVFLLMFGQVAHSTCNSSIPETSPSARFTDNGDGTVTDARTALMWNRCAYGQTWSSSTCAGTASKHTWQDALQLAEASTYAGYSDWRLPNIKELATIVERRCANPAINEAIFPATPTFYFWSSSPLVQGLGTWAHNVSFSDGSDSTEDKASSNTYFYGHFRMVRAAR